MSLARIRIHYGVPAKRGARVRYTGGMKPKEGTITGSDGMSLRIRMDDGRVRKYHPGWMIEYLEPVK